MPTGDLTIGKVPPELKLEFKMACMRRGKDMGVVLRDLMKRYTDWEKEKREEK